MKRGELAKELRNYADCTNYWQSDKPPEGFARVLLDAAAYLDDDSLERDGRRWRALEELKSRHKYKWYVSELNRCIRLIIQDDQKSWIKFPHGEIGAALDAWIEEHPHET